MSRHINVSTAGLFVGCGGLDLGFKMAGYGLQWANEYDADAASSYQQLVGHPVVVGDIWNHIHDVPKVDVLIGGPPCQAFSLVGKRLQDDPRATLVFAFQQVVERVRPKVFVLENVPGLMASRVDGVRLPQHLAGQFEAMGYQVSILTLMATDFFVPQKRKRVIMVGHRMAKKTFGLVAAESLARSLQEPGLRPDTTVAQALDDLPDAAPKGSLEPIAYRHSPGSAYARLMRRRQNGLVSHQSMPTMSALDREFVRHIPPGGNYTSIPDSISTKRILSFKATGGRTTTYGRLHPDRPAYTINTYFNRPNVGANYHHRHERLITVREALRLQSFPDHFSPVHRNQRSLHAQIGNAVPPLMAYALAQSVNQLFL